MSDPLMSAIEAGDVAAVTALLHQGMSVSATKERAPLHAAAKAGNTAVVKLLLENGADAIAVVGQQQPIHLASSFGDAEMIRALVENGANPNAKTESWNTPPLAEAIRHQRWETWKALVEAGADVSASSGKGGRSLLHEAALVGWVEVLPVLLAAVEISQPDKIGETPLHNAATRGHAAMIQRLLDAGAERDALGKSTWGDHGGTPLHSAAENNRVQAIEVLLAAGAPIEGLSKDGKTPLHVAAYHGALDAADCLIQRGADIESHTKRGGWTPLHVAAAKRRDAMAELLLKHNANRAARTKRKVDDIDLDEVSSKVTASDIAKLAGAEDLAERLATSE